MKTIIRNITLSLLCLVQFAAASAQSLPDPAVNSAMVSPAPIPKNHPKDISVIFHLVNNGFAAATPDARSKVTVTLGQLDIADDFDPAVDILSSNNVQYYTWTYDQTTKVFTGVLTTTIPILDGTFYTIKNLVSIGTSDLSDPKNGLAVNIVAPPELNATTGNLDNTTAYTSSASNILLPLSLNLLSFTGTATGCTAALNWITANEINNSHFEVQRSLDGAHFSEVGKVEASNALAENKYSFITPLARSSGGKNYFRLKMVDKAGGFSNSPLVILSCTMGVQITAAPNPVTSRVKLSGLNGGKYTIGLYDISGHQLQRMRVQGVTNQVLGMQQYGAGIYIIRLTDEQGSVTSLKVIKK